MRRLAALASLFLALPASAISIDWVTVGDPGNPADTEVMDDGTTGYGSVPYVYRIATYELTNAQYAEFLNAVAATDPNGLYHTAMLITRNGSSGSFTYSPLAERENRPVNVVSFYDALRFANWLHNGQPVGAQDGSTTEDGAYTITAQGVADNSITRNPGARFFLPSEDEWYKAAYYDATLSVYYDYPAGTDTIITCAAPGPTPNTANCTYEGEGWFIEDVGGYTGSPSPYGTFDQGGNLFEWNEAVIRGSRRGMRGGSYFRNGASALAAWNRASNNPGSEANPLGFRVAMIPEPDTALLVAGGLLALAARRRLRTALDDSTKSPTLV